MATILVLSWQTRTTLALQQKFLRGDTLPLSRLASVLNHPTCKEARILTHSHSHQECFHLLGGINVQDRGPDSSSRGLMRRYDDPAQAQIQSEINAGYFHLHPIDNPGPHAKKTAILTKEQARKQQGLGRCQRECGT